MKYTHSLVYQTAREMAGELYEMWAKDDAFYRQWPNEKRFIKAWWPNLTGEAYDALVKMLGCPDDRVSPLLKEKIYEAVIGHRTLNPDNDPGQTVQIALN